MHVCTYYVSFSPSIAPSVQLRLRAGGVEEWKARDEKSAKRIGVARGLVVLKAEGGDAVGAVG